MDADTTPLAPAISSDADAPGADPFSITIAFSEPVTGFELEGPSHGRKQWRRTSEAPSTPPSTADEGQRRTVGESAEGTRGPARPPAAARTGCRVCNLRHSQPLMRRKPIRTKPHETG